MKKLTLSLILTILLTAYPVWAFGDLTALEKPGLKKPPEISGSIVEDPDEGKNGKDKKEPEASEEDPDKQTPKGEGSEGSDGPEENPDDPVEESAEASDKEGSGLSVNELTEQPEEKEEEIKIPATVSVNTKEPDIVKKEEPVKDTKWWDDNEYLILLSSGVVIALLLLLLLVRHIRRRKRSTYAPKDLRTNPPGDEVIRREAIKKPAAGDVELDIKMIEGSLKKGNGSFYMHRDIIVGSCLMVCTAVLCSLQ